MCVVVDVKLLRKTDDHHIQTVDHLRVSAEEKAVGGGKHEGSFLWFDLSEGWILSADPPYPLPQLQLFPPPDIRREHPECKLSFANLRC